MQITLLMTPEKLLLSNLRPVTPFLQLFDIAKVITLNKKVLAALSQIPYLVLYAIKKFYLNETNVHPRIRRYFKCLLTKRVKLDFTRVSATEWEIFAVGVQRTMITRNLIRDAYCCKGRDGWERTRNGGNGWRLENMFVPKLYMKCLVASFSICELAYKAKFDEFSIKFLKDFRAGETLIRGGCFISRRADCAASGGCRVIIYNQEKQVVFLKEHKRTSDQIPASWDMGVKYEELFANITINDLPENIKLEECHIELRIFGKDDRFWHGWYGPRFWGMYIRGDYNQDPLYKITNSV